MFKAAAKTTGFNTEYVLFVKEAKEGVARTEYLLEDDFPTDLPVGFDYGVELGASGGYYFTSATGAKYINWDDEE